MKRKTRTGPTANDVQLFHLYPNGCGSFGKWLNYHRRMHGRHPLGCLHFGEKWLQLWDAVGRLLVRPARREGKRRSTWFVIDHDTVANSLKFEITRAGIFPLRKGAGCRVVLFDGTIVKEWGGK